MPTPYTSHRCGAQHLTPRPWAPGGDLRVHASIAQRRDRRSVMPRSALAEFSSPQNRPNSVDLLESQAADRIADLLPVGCG
jgi:hypothetical protein